MTLADAPHQPALRLGLPRPRLTDPAVERDAVAAFSADLAKGGYEGIGDDAAEIADDLRRISPIGSASGGELAERMYRWSLREADMDAVEALDGWSYALIKAHDAHLRSWVTEQGVVCPFRGVARARVAKRGQEGAVYGDGDGAAKGRCLFVPDAERTRFMTEGAFSGGWVVDWEDLTDLSPPTEQDTAAHEARSREDERRAARKAEPYVSMDLGAAYRPAMRIASRSTAETLRIDAAAAVAALATKGADFDATSPEVVALVAALVTLSRVPASG